MDYLGTYVSCFSSINNSVLMWAHYSKSNTGICVEYDFNKLQPNHLLKQSIFPVRYTGSPVDLSDLLVDDYKGSFKNPLEAAVLCGALNKSDIWSYEKEWRLVWVWASMKDLSRRLPLKASILPSKIYLGYHFLRPLFYYDSKYEYADAKNNIEQLLRLINYIDEHNIEICIILPSVGQYALKSFTVEINKLKQRFTRGYKRYKETSGLIE